MKNIEATIVFSKVTVIKNKTCSIIENHRRVLLQLPLSNYEVTTPNSTTDNSKSIAFWQHRGFILLASHGDAIYAFITLSNTRLYFRFLFMIASNS